MDITNQPFVLIPSSQFGNIDLISVIVMIAAIGIIGLFVYANDKKNLTNKSFLLISVITMIWCFANYITYHEYSIDMILWVQRIVIFLGVWHSYAFLQFFYVFPEKDKTLSKSYKLILLPYVALVSILTLTPFVFPKIDHLAPYGLVSMPEIRGGVFIFIATVIGLITASIIILSKKIYMAKAPDRRKYMPVLIGTIITFSLLFTFNLILPCIFANVTFIPLGALFIFPFIACTAYAICKHQLFGIRVIVIEVATLALWIMIATHIPFAKDAREVFVEVNLLVITIIFCATIIYAILHEMRQHEKYQKLIVDLSKAYKYIHLLEHPMNEKVFGLSKKEVDEIEAVIKLKGKILGESENNRTA